MNLYELMRVTDPLVFMQTMWPQYSYYDLQQEMIYSCKYAVETDVVAGNKLGKDFISGGIATTCFVAPQVFFPIEYVKEIERLCPRGDPWYLRHTRRIITTSVKDDHLDVLWAEIARFVKSARFPLLAEDGGPLFMTHHEIRWKEEADHKNPANYLKGMVSKLGEGLAGHHANYTMGIGDESSGLVNEVHKQFQGWAKRLLYFGNPNPCENFWKKNYQDGPVLHRSRPADIPLRELVRRGLITGGGRPA